MKRLVSIVLALSFILSFCTYASASVVREDSRQCDYGKMSEEVIAFFEAAEDEDVIDVYVIIEDVDEDEVMATFAERYPDEYAEYMKAYEADVPPEIIAGDKAKMEEEILRDDLNNNIDGDLLQAGIEKKREVFREFYNEKNGEIIKKLFTDDQVIFCSEYAPMAIVHATKLQLLSMLENDAVLRLEKYADLKFVTCLSTAYQTTNITYLRDTCGNTGNNVKIGQIELDVPDITDSDLSSATIYRYPSTATTDDHPTQVAKILVGTNYGVAPSATLYSYGMVNDSESQFYVGVEYLLSQGVNVINCSGGFFHYGYYSVASQWTDHLAIQHDVHFVACAGNLESYNPAKFVLDPAMGYNVIAVGGYYSNGTVKNTDDGLSSFSCTEEDWVGHGPRAEKPNLIAPAESLSIPGWSGTQSGTSYAAPMVTGVIADLCSYNYTLKVKQTAIGAIMEAGCIYKIYGVQGNGIRGDKFTSYYRVDSMEQISNEEGAGKLDAKASRYMVTTAQWGGTTVNATSLPYTQTFYIDSSSNSLTRIALFWLKRNSLSGTHSSATPTGDAFSNLNLQVLGPNGNVVASSTTQYANFEIVQFVPTVTGNYTIKVVRASGSASKENIGLAIY